MREGKSKYAWEEVGMFSEFTRWARAMSMHWVGSEVALVRFGYREETQRLAISRNHIFRKNDSVLYSSPLGVSFCEKYATLSFSIISADS